MGNQLLGKNLNQNPKDWSFYSQTLQNQVSKQYKHSEKIEQILQKQGKDIQRDKILNTQYKIYGNDCFIGKLDENNKPNGYGQLIRSDGSILISNFENGRANGQGLYIFEDGSFYKGNIKQNQACGWGKFVNKNLEYEGQFKNNSFQGKGQLSVKDGSKAKFDGDFKQNYIQKGKLIWQQLIKGEKEILEYDGQFDLQGNFCGEGILISSKGKYNGWFQNNQKHGRGKFYYKKGVYFVGEYKDNLKHGQGTLFNSSISLQGVQYVQNEQLISYRGNFEQGLPHRKGQIFNSQTRKFQQYEYNQGISKSNLYSDIHITWSRKE